MIKFPICVIIYLTDYCPLKCKHCFFTQQNSLNKHMLDFTTLKQVLNVLKNNGVYMVAFTGGDPMLHPDIFRILNYTSELNMLPLLGISGIRITREIARKIYDSGVRCVQIGLNGSTKILNDKYRGSEAFGKIAKNILILQKEKLNVNLSFCLDKNNFNDLKNMLDFSNSMDAYKVKIEFWKNLINPLNNELDDKQKIKAFKTCFNYMKINNKPDWIQCPKSKSNLSKIHKSSIIIMPNGDVKRNEISLALGNIYKNNIIDILRGDEMNYERQ